ncbi:MAG: CCA tRNA nucleotidyltransferase [Kiritimatiellae bacterium]|nr:CCA tRNA nucleotidyltransferase [Kiritimatiellia bacterium]
MVKADFSRSDQALLEAASATARKLADAGHTVLFAGGCVRDALCRRPVKDIDIATSARPEEVEAVFKGRSVSVGKAFGVIVVLCGRYQFDVATFRNDGAYIDGRHPEQIHFSCPEEDAQRRDFTINGIFCDPFSREIIDYVGGLADIERGIIRAIGSARERLEEDHLRMLRAVRFAAVMEFTIEAQTWQAICALAPRISRVSVERIAKEFVRTLCEAPQPSIALNMLRESGLLVQFLPEVVALYGVEQPPQFHPEGDVWTHTGMMLDGVEAPRDPVLALGILFHDIGKPVTYSYQAHPKTGEKRIRFMCHAEKGVKMTGNIMSRLKLPNSLMVAVQELVGHHMRFIDAHKMRRATLRRLLGLDNIHHLLELNRLDSLCSNGDLSGWEFAVDQFEALKDEPALPPPLVTGRILIEWGFKPGPQMGLLLKKLYDAQLEGQLTTLEHARKMLRLR